MSLLMTSMWTEDEKTSGICLKSAERSHQSFCLRAVHLGRRHLVSDGCGFLSGEVGNILPARLDLEGRPLPGEIFERVLVSGVRGQPDLSPDLLVIVLQRKRHAARRHADHTRASQAEAHGNKIRVV